MGMDVPQTGSLGGGSIAYPTAERLDDTRATKDPGALPVALDGLHIDLGRLEEEFASLLHALKPITQPVPEESGMKLGEPISPSPPVSDLTAQTRHACDRVSDLAMRMAALRSYLDVR